jgi:hypothetical protein
MFTELEAEFEEIEHDIVKVLVPACEILTASVPLVPLVPDQAPEAVQEVAFLDDHSSVACKPTSTSEV